MKRSPASLRSPKRDHPLIEPLEARIAPAANVWQGGSSGNWNVNGNWSDGIPTSDDDVIVDPLNNQTVAITMNSSTNVANTITMSGDDSLTLFNSSLTLSSGTASEISNLALTGFGTAVSTFGDLTLTGASSMVNNAVLMGHGKIFNTGTLSLSGGPKIQTELQDTGTMTMTNGTCYVSGATAKVRVFGGGVLNLTSASLQRPNGGLGVFIEDGGTLNSVTGTNYAGGAIFVDGGDVNVTGVPGDSLQFNASTSLHDATFHVAAGTIVYFNGNVQNAVSGTITGMGAGAVVINGSSSFDLADDTVFNFAAGQLVFQNNAAIAGPGTLTNVGFVQGSPVLKTKVLDTGTFAPTGTLTFSGANAELRILAGGTIGSTGINLGGDATSKGLIVESGGQLIGSFASGAVPVQVLGGTVKTAGSTVQFNGTTSLVGALLDTTGGGVIYFQSGSTTTFGGTITGTGPAGTAVFANGAATFNVAAGGAILDFAPGMAVFHDATINGPGVLTTVGEMLISANNPILRTELRVEGTLNLIGTNPNLTFDGAAGLLRIADGGSFVGGSNVNGHGIGATNGGKGILIEHGGLFQSGGGLTVTAPFDNQGTVLVDSALRLNGPVAQISGTVGNIALSGGTWIQHGNSFFDILNTSINTIGAGADVTVGSGIGRFPPITGLTNNAGTLRLIEGQNNIQTTSQFTNSGTIILTPGTDIDTGTFTQAANGVIEFQIAGTATNQIGRLIGTASATLAGTARIVVTGGFDPAAAQSFPLMSFASHTGTFTKVEGLNIGHANVFEAAYTATTFSLNSLVSAADLDVDTITIPGASVAGNDVSFSYTVKNVSAFATPVANWTDTIYLSRDGTLDANDIVLTRVAHNGVVATNGTYTANVTVPLVGALPDNYRLIVVADSQGFVADTDRANNTLASTGAFALDVQVLTPGAAFNGSIANNRDQYFKVTLPGGQTPTFTLTGAVAGEAEIYESLGEVPTRSHFDESTFTAGSTVQRLAGEATAAATYYVLLHGRESAGAGQNFSLLASGIGFDIADTSVAHGANIGNVTTTLTGSQFSPATTFTLVSGGTTRAATANYFHDSQSADATFDLTGLAAGSYSIVANNSGPTDTLANAFTVTNGGFVGTLQYDLSVPRAIRPPFVGTAVTLTYENIGDTDLAAPLFTLFSDNARIRLADQSDFSIGALELLGVSGGLAGVLSPGEKATIEVIFEPINATAHVFSNFEVFVADYDPAPLDLAALKSSLKPAQVANDAWDAIFTNFQASAGATLGSYKAMLVDNANYLGQFGKVSPEVTHLVEFELEQAGDFGALASRFALGTLGRGQAAPFSEIALESAGLVTISDGINSRFFFHQPDGTFTGLGLDHTHLTKTGGAFLLDEGNGTKTSYRASDGRIEYAEDANGNRITAGRDANGRLLTLTESVSNHVSTFTYNAQGRIASLTDSVGRATTYGYDASSEHLTTITDARGATTLTYTPAGHAIASITGPNGVKISYAYDAAGRVMSETAGTGAGAITTTYTHDSAGKVTTTDAAGHVSQIFRVENAAVVRTVDQLGNITSLTYDALGRLVGATDATGVSTRAEIDALGNLTGVSQSDRAETTFDFAGELRRIHNVTNPLGGVTHLDYDANGNLLSSVLPDGFGDHFEYDAKGRVTAATDANGNRTTLTYDAAGFLSRRDFSDGTHNDYGYDAHGNLTTATTAEGTTTLTYDAADRVLSIAYANGKSIAITYDAAGRRATVADQTGYTVRYSYDSLGRIDEVRDTANALLVNYDYDALGQLAKETRGNGSTTTYTRDDIGRVTGIAHANGAVMLETFAYTYDAKGRVKTQTDDTGTTTYTYDLNGQLTGAALPGGRTIAYTYNADGNRVAVSDSVAGNENFTSNLADQYTTAGTETLTYDHAGRIVARTAGGITTSYSYDREGRLSGVVSPGNVIAYQYDALGNRIGKTENGVHTDFAYDPVGYGTVFGEYQGANTTHYASGMGLAARADAGGTAFYHFDAAGNTALVTNSASTTVASYHYLPFGEATATGALAQPFTFGGRLGVQDDAGDLFYMHARVYDSSLGRFTTRDPLGFSGGDANPYRYVGNDPINASDPSGFVTLSPAQAQAFLLKYGDAARSEASKFVASLWTEAEAAAIVAQTEAENLAASEMFGQLAANLEAASAETKALAIYDGATDVIADVTVNGIASEVPTATLGLGARILNGGKSLLNPANIGKGLKSLLSPANLGKGLLLGVGIEAAKYTGKNIAAPGVIAGFKKIDDYFRDQRENQPVDPAFDPNFIKKNADNVLFNVFYKNAISEDKTQQDAILDARAKVKQAENEAYRKTHPPGAAGAAARVTMGAAEVIRPGDPNNIVGPSGAGADPVPDTIAPGQTRFDGFVGANANFPYKIEFENQPTASAPAQVVHVTQTLDSDLDFSTFAFTSFGFGANRVDVPAGANGTSFHTIYDATATLGVLVKIDAALDTITGLLDVTYTSLDPATNDVPLDPFAGFLPTENGTGRGDGFLTYSVKPKSGLANATVFTALASIVFDTEAAIATPTVTNKLDTLVPTSQVAAFAGATTQRSTFAVRWTGADDATGSGLAGITLSYTDNGGPLLTATVANADGGFRFPGEVGHTYAFFSQAVDNVGNTSVLPATPEQSITVVAPVFIDVGKKHAFTDSDGDIYTVTYSGKVGSAKVALLNSDAMGHGAIDILQVDGSDTKSKVTVTVKKNKHGGDGIVTIGDVTVNGALGAFTAPHADLVVNGLVASGAVKSITVRDVLRPDAILADPLLQTGGTATAKTSIATHTLADGFVLAVPGVLSSLTAMAIGDGVITAASVGKITVKGGAFAADLTTAGKIGGITVKGGGLSGALTAASFGAISVNGGDMSGELISLTPAVTLGRTSTLKSLLVSGGDLTGDVRLLGNAGPITVKNAKTVGGNVTGATITAAKIAALTVAKDFTAAFVLAGADLGSDHTPGGTGDAADTFAGGRIGKVRIGGAVTAGVIGAGLDPTDGVFHDANDANIGGQASVIASLIIKGQADATSYFAAGLFKKKPKIDGQTIDPMADPRFLVA